VVWNPQQGGFIPFVARRDYRPMAFNGAARFSVGLSSRAGRELAQAWSAVGAGPAFQDSSGTVVLGATSFWERRLASVNPALSRRWSVLLGLLVPDGYATVVGAGGAWPSRRVFRRCRGQWRIHPARAGAAGADVGAAGAGAGTSGA